MVLLVIDAFDDVSLFAHAGIRKSRVSGGKIFQVRLERTDVNRRPMWYFFAKTDRIIDFLHRFKSIELTHANSHGIALMDEAIRRRLSATVSAIGISGRPIS